MQNRLQSISFMLKFGVTQKEAREKLIAMKNILKFEMHAYYCLGKI